MKVLLINLSDVEQTIVYGDRIAQMVFAKVDVAEFIEVTQLNETQRAAGGFGHTGLK